MWVLGGEVGNAAVSSHRPMSYLLVGALVGFVAGRIVFGRRATFQAGMAVGRAEAEAEATAQAATQVTTTVVASSPGAVALPPPLAPPLRAVLDQPASPGFGRPLDAGSLGELVADGVSFGSGWSERELVALGGRDDDDERTDDDDERA